VSACTQAIAPLPESPNLHDRLDCLLFILLGVDFGDGGAVVSESSTALTPRDDAGGVETELAG